MCVCEVDQSNTGETNKKLMKITCSNHFPFYIINTLVKGGHKRYVCDRQFIFPVYIYNTCSQKIIYEDVIYLLTLWASIPRSRFLVL